MQPGGEARRDNPLQFKFFLSKEENVITEYR